MSLQGSLGVDVGDLSVSSFHVQWQLRGDAHGVTELSLSRAKLTKDFRDGHGFDASSQELVQGLGARRDLDDFLAFLQAFRSRHEAGALLVMTRNLASNETFSLAAASRIFSTLASLMPLMAQRSFLVLHENEKRHLLTQKMRQKWTEMWRI